MKFSADVSPLTHRFLRRRALDKLLGETAIGDYQGVPGNTRREIGEEFREGRPVDDIVAGVRNEHGLSPEQELQTRLRLEENAPDVREIVKAKLAADAGLDTESLIASSRQRALERLEGSLNPAQYANALNERDAAPFDLKSGAVFNRFEGDVADETDANRALAYERIAGGDYDNARAQHEALRARAIARVFDDPDTDPLLAADIANDKEVADASPETVSYIDPEGNRRTGTAKRRPDGSYMLTTTRDEGGHGIRLANEPQADNTRQVKAPITVWRQAVSDASRELKTEPRFRNRAIDTQTLEARALEIYRVLQNDKTAQPPAAVSAGDIVEELNERTRGDGAASQPAAADNPASGNNASGRDSVSPERRDQYLEQARRAVRSGADEGAVRERLQSLGVDPSLL